MRPIPMVHFDVRLEVRPCVLSALASAGLALGSVGAQQTRTRVTTTTGSASSRCAELTSSPTLLTEGPEGRALLRLKRELDDAAVVIRQRVDSDRSVEIRRISQAQRGVDSLMQIIVRYKNADGSDGEAITIRRGDSIPRIIAGRRLSPGIALFESMEGSLRAVAPMMDSALRWVGPDIEVAIRSMQPQIAAFSEAARMHMPMRVAMPTGWLGMHLSESKITVMSPEGALTNYCDYPVIEAVDAGSPAEKSGLSAGDTVLAYNGRDVRTQAVNYAELLVPGQTVRMRVRRGNRARDLSVVVGARPTPDRAMTFSNCGPGQVCERVTGTFSFAPFTSPTSPVPPTPATPPLPPTPAVGTMLAGTGMAVIAGAQLSVIDDEFAQSMGLESGLLALRVPAGTPAADAGLRPGDVIRAVNGTPVRDLAPLRRAFSSTQSREVRLTVVTRGTAPRVLVVRW